MSEREEAETVELKYLPALADLSVRSGLRSLTTLEVDAKMRIGAREYGDASFELTPDQLSAAIGEELIDVIGWGTFLYMKLQNRQLKERLCEVFRQSEAMMDEVYRIALEAGE